MFETLMASQMGAFAIVIAAGQIATAIAVMVAFSTVFGQGKIGVAAIESVARQPEAKGSITTTMFISMAFSETGGIYGLVVALLLLFANPLVSQFVSYMP
jgi:F-type H+-transporting ATPase subunit c